MCTTPWNLRSRRDQPPPPIPFAEALKPRHSSRQRDEAKEFWRQVSAAPGAAHHGSVDAGNEALSTLDDISRKIDDLARQLNCLGYFDDQPGPRAA